MNIILWFCDIVQWHLYHYEYYFFTILSGFMNYDVSMNDLLWYMLYGYMWKLGLYESVYEWMLITLILQMMMVVVLVNIQLVFFIILFMCLQSFKKSNPTSLLSFTMYYLNEKSSSIIWVILHSYQRTILSSYQMINDNPFYWPWVSICTNIRLWCSD